MITKTALTWSEYRRLPESDPYEHEMIDGEEFLSPSPNYWHQRLAHRLSALLDAYLSGQSTGVIVHPVDLYYDERNYVSPDLAYFTHDQDRTLLDAGRIELPPPLVVEVLSKSSVKWDRDDKRRFYKRFGVLEYWIVDPFDQTIEVIDLEADSSSMSDPATSKILPGFHVSWPALFAPRFSPRG